jgi:hypothetical protein
VVTLKFFKKGIENSTLCWYFLENSVLEGIIILLLKFEYFVVYYGLLCICHLCETSGTCNDSYGSIFG